MIFFPHMDGTTTLQETTTASAGARVGIEVEVHVEEEVDVLGDSLREVVTIRTKHSPVKVVGEVE